MEPQFIICLSNLNAKIEITGIKNGPKWKFFLCYEGESSDNIEVNSWIQLIFWLHHYDWRSMKVQDVNPDFENKLLKLYQSGEKSHFSSQQRILDMYIRLLSGEKLLSKNLAFEYGVDDEVVRSNIRLMRPIVENYGRSIFYNRKEKIYEVEKAIDSLTTGEVLIFLMLLNQSRSLIKDERRKLEEKLLSLFSLTEQQKLKRFFRSYHYYYKPTHSKSILDTINQIFQAILQQQLISFDYTMKDSTIHRVVKPLTIIFHDHTFYLAAHIHNKNKPNPAYYQIHKIENLETLSETFTLDQGNDFFKVGEYTNQTINMFTGKQVVVTLKVKKGHENYVYRSFPECKHVKDDGDFGLFEMTVLGTEGIIYWILSQEDRVEVISPNSLREEILNRVGKILNLYK